MLTISREVFRAYDIRGVADEQITEHLAYRLGQAFAAFARLAGETKLCIGRDARLSGERLQTALLKGLLEGGVDVVQLGVIATPVLYFATCRLDCSSGIMVTASHNPGNYNGFKLVLQGKSLTPEEIAHLYTLVQVLPSLPKREGVFTEYPIIDEYIDYIASNIHLKKALTIVVDSGNGMGSEIAPKLFRRLGCTVHELYCVLDGRFPNHHPDPSRPENLVDLQKAVLEKQADVGLAFDGDADRLGVVTNKGEVIWPDRQMMLFAQAVLKETPGATILYDVKCSKYLGDVIKKAGGQAVMWKTGHSLMKLKLKEIAGALGGEMSGHIFFQQRWFGFDDAIYTGARLLEILSQAEVCCSTLFAALPNAIATPELNVAIPENEKFSFVEKLITAASSIEAEKILLDGLRLEFKDGWALMRASNTSPIIVTRFEADSPAALSRIQMEVKQLMQNVKPDLVFPF